MKRKLILIAICFILVLLLLPLKYQYKDGGTIEYRAVLYSIIKWHTIDNNYEDGYKTDVEYHFFPANLRKIDYYMNTEPQRLELIYNEKTYYASTLDYNWCNSYNNCSSREVLLSKDIEFEDAIKTKENDTIYLLSPAKIEKVVVYKGTLDNMYTQDIEHSDEYIKVPNEKGDYVYILNCSNDKNTVNYLFKVIVE